MYAVTYSPYTYSKCDWLLQSCKLLKPVSSGNNVLQLRDSKWLQVVARKQFSVSADGHDDEMMTLSDQRSEKKIPICSSQDKLSVLWNSPKGRALWSEWLIHHSHLWKQDVNSTNVNPWIQTKTIIFFGDALSSVSCGVAGQNFFFFLKRYFLPLLAIWKCRQQFKCLYLSAQVNT